ncbi:CVNH domain-containing protein [Tahibacter caeni]|uniref:CVNH domain-containing protein n=1 Tax=Tahibacter caeni TaxID=1453545 RepID=UPI0021478B86|nr:CVNH domain-containing protein [Tahibacter caeni]
MKTLLLSVLFAGLLVGPAIAEEEAGGEMPPPFAKAANGCSLPPHTTTFSFWNSCSNVVLEGCTLKADCREANGKTRATTFDMSKFDQCYSDFFAGRNLVNNNGKLCCGYAGTKMICGT